MKVWYPGLPYSERPPRLDLIALLETPLAELERTQCHARVRTWTGAIQPFASDVTVDEVEHIIADLRDGLEVDIGANGTLHHATKCERRHALPVALKPLRKMDVVYTVEIAARIPPGHPIVRALDPPILPYPVDPSIDPITVRSMLQRTPHLLEPLCALCVMFPSDGSWNWDWGDGIREYADQTAIWLAKYTLWRETKARLGPRKGIWLGEDVPHGPREMLRRIGPNDPCHCGKGMTYSLCCQSKDVWLARAEDAMSSFAGRSGFGGN